MTIIYVQLVKRRILADTEAALFSDEASVPQFYTTMTVSFRLDMSLG